MEALVRVVHSQIEQRRAEDPALASIKEQASVSDEYQAILETLKSGLKSHEVKTKVGKSHPARKLQNVWSRLGILPDEHGSLMTLDNNRLVIPEGAQKKLVNQAHMSHQGVTRTLRSLTVRYYWPKMRNMVRKRCSTANFVPDTTVHRQGILQSSQKSIWKSWIPWRWWAWTSSSTKISIT